MLLEIASGVAIAAADFQMHSQERIFCFRMVELHRRIHFFPAGCRVAGFARSLESALVRIGVAGDAGVKLDPRELHRLVRAGREVALLAGHLGVHSGQRIFCFRMVELLGLLPVGHVVAALAIGAELPFVDVLMAGRAILRKAQKGMWEVLSSESTRAAPEPCAPAYGTSRKRRPHAFPPADIRPGDDRIA